jgi:hypothetical protein
MQNWKANKQIFSDVDGSVASKNSQLSVYLICETVLGLLLKEYST